MSMYCNGVNCRHDKENCPKYKNYKKMIEETGKCNNISNCGSGCNDVFSPSYDPGCDNGQGC